MTWVQDVSGGSNCRHGRNSETTKSEALRCDWIAAISRWANDELLVMDEKRKWFLEMESTSGKDALKTVEIQRFRL